MKSDRAWPLNALHELVNRPANQLPGLDGLRAMAVLFVVCDHWVYEWTVIAGQKEPWLAKLPNFYWGWTGVDLFFVLSGFLIGKQLWGELHRSGSIDVGQFVLRRGLRIWPLYYAFMALLWVIGSSRAPSWPDWVMLSNYFDGQYGRSWSLSTEEQFYLLMPTLLVVFSRVIRKQWLPYCVLGLLAAVVTSRAITFHVLEAQGLPSKQISSLMYSAFHLHCEPLLIGLLIAWTMLHRPAWLASAEVGKPAYRVIAVTGTIAFAGVALRMASREVFAYLALAMVYGSMLCVALTDRSILTAILRWRIWYFIARVSFGMYLNHLILREPTDTILALVQSMFGLNSTIAFLIGLLLTVIASSLTAAVTFVLIEQPGLALRDRWMSRKREQTGAPASRIAANHS